MEKESLSKEILEFVRNEIVEKTSELEIDQSTPLISTNTIDSLSLVKLVLYLEKKYSVNFGMFEISEKVMDCIDQMAELIIKKRQDQ